MRPVLAIALALAGFTSLPAGAAPVAGVTASLSGGNLTITDGAGVANTLTAIRSGANLVISDPVELFTSAPAEATLSDGNKTLTIPVSSVTGAITFNTAAGNDTVTLDLSGGDFINGAGVSFNGGDPVATPGDQLNIIGGDQGAVTYNYTNAHDGSIVMSNIGTVAYTGLEPITNSGTATDVVFNLPGIADSAIFLEDNGATPADSMLRLRSTLPSFEQTDFALPSGSLTINLGAGNQTLALTGTPQLACSLTINGGTGDDTILLQSTATFAANKNLNIDLQDDAATPGIDIINLSTAGSYVLSGTGTATLRVSKNILIQGRLQTEDGAIVMEANQQAVPTALSFIGINVSGAFAKVECTGTGAITLLGKGGNATSNHGVQVINSGSMVRGGFVPNGDSVTIVGQAVAGTTSIGAFIPNGDIFTLAGNIRITGSGWGAGAGSQIQNGSTIQPAENYNVIIDVKTQTATGPVAALNMLNVGSVDTGIYTTGTGTVTLIADSFALQTGGSAPPNIGAGTSTVFIRPKTTGHNIDIGSAATLAQAGVLDIADTELDRITAGTVMIGDSNSGTIFLTNQISPANYQTLGIGKAFAFTVGATTGGFVADVSSAAVYKRIQAAGAVTIDPGAILSVNAVGGFVPSASDFFKLIDNTSAAATSGTFIGLPQGAAVNVGGVSKFISYMGNGNDVTLTGNDATPPDTSIVEAEPNPTSDRTGDFTFASGEAGVSYQVSVDSAAFGDATNPFSTAALADGPHTLAVRAIDPAGNVDPTPATYSWTVNTAAPAVISFSSATYAVNQGATTVTLTLVRQSGELPATVTVNTEDGVLQKVPPFAAAAAGTDYTDLTGPATLVSFGAGDASKTVEVTLIPKTATTTPNKHFSARLSNPTNGASLGAVSGAEIRILANDTAKPTLTVTAPAAGTATVPVPTVSSVSPYVIKGTAGDAKGLDRVEVVVNGGAPVAAVLGSATAPTSVPWSLGVAPSEGLNEVVITAHDLRGNSTSITRSFNFVRRYLLSLSRSAPVGTALDAAGTVTVTASPTTAASALSPTAANSNPKSSMVVPGTPVKVTAMAKTGFTFSHWTGLPGGVTALGNVLNLTMPASDVVGITAVFVSNPFAGEAGASNVFYGLLQPQGATPFSNATHGFLTGTLSPANGLFSGKVLINGLAKSFTGYFYGDGRFLFTVGTAKQYELDLGGQELELYYDSGSITATVTGSGVSSGAAVRGHYSATRKVDAALLNQTVPATAPAPNKGFFTIALPAKTQSPPLAATAYPQGAGYASLTLNDNGTLSLSGVLADGSTVTGSSGVVAGGTAPIFVQIATPGAAATVKGGSLSGQLNFNTSAPDSDVSGVNLLWFRPAVTPVASPATAAAATALYTDGWPAGIRVDAVGALYDKTVDVQTALVLGATDATNGNGQLEFEFGKLSSLVTETGFNIAPGATAGTSTVTKTLPANPNFTLSVMQGTGLFNGTFKPNWTNPATTKPGFKGILLQKGLNKGGFGFFLSNRVGDADPESGEARLGPLP